MIDSPKHINLKMKLLLACILLILFALSSNYAQSLNIIPQPVSEVTNGEKYIVHNGSNIFLSSNDNELRRIAWLFVSKLHRRTGLNIDIKTGRTNKGIILSLDRNISSEKNGYELTVDSNKIKISGKDYAGIFYGIQTLQEILKKDTVIYFPGCKIIDYPRYQYRGFMLDASRHFQSIEFVKRILNVMAVLKLNIFHWHLADDQGWRIESKRYPKLNEIGSYRDSLNSVERNGYYTVEEIKNIIQYAKKLYIKIIPEIEMPGHSEAVMDSYPGLLCSTNKKGNTYCAGNIKDYKFINNVLDEVINIFDTDFIHVGGDERPKGVWGKDPACKKIMSTQHLANEGMLQNYFIDKICKYLSSKNVKTIAWAENIKGGVPVNQIVENYYPDVSMEVARDKLYTINANCFYTYFDYPNSVEEKKNKPDWMPVLDLGKVYSFNPTPDSLEESAKKYIIGSECALWTELILEHDVQYQLFPRILAFSEVVWSPVKNKNYSDFLNRVNTIKSYINSMGFEFDGEKATE